MANKIKANYVWKKDTKNTEVFEQSIDDETKVAPVIYFSKSLVQTLGNPKILTITVEME